MTARRRPGRKLLDSRLLAEVSRGVSSLAEKEGVRVALLGGVAMQFYGSPRLTADVDFVSDGTLSETDELKSTGVLSFGGKKYVVVGKAPVDIIVREDEYAGLYQEALDRADSTDEGFLVVTPEHLAVMKFSTQRSKDDIDLMWLLAQKDLVDVEKAEAIVRRHLGGRFAVNEFRQIVNEVAWRSRGGEFEDKSMDDDGGSEE